MSSLSHPLPDDGVKSIGALLRGSAGFPSLLPHVFSFLSVVELMYIQQVNRRWYHDVYTARGHLIHKLNLGQFWSRLGVLDLAHFTRLTSAFHSVTELNLAYCHFLTPQHLIDLVHSIPHFERIERLNLFYCYGLDDAAISSLIPALPALTDLNLGRCIRITDRTVRSLASLQHLRSLTLTSLPALSEETLMLFDDPAYLSALQTLTLVNAGKFTQVEVDEVRATRPQLRIVGPEEQHQQLERNGKRKGESRKEINDT